jgi:hypothetical protein
VATHAIGERAMASGYRALDLRAQVLATGDALRAVQAAVRIPADANALADR